MAGYGKEAQVSLYQIGVMAALRRIGELIAKYGDDAHTAVDDEIAKTSTATGPNVDRYDHGYLDTLYDYLRGYTFAA